MKTLNDYEELRKDPFREADNRIKTFEEFNTTKERVYSLLSRFKSCRDSDKHLIIHFLESYGIHIPNNVKKRLLKELPSFETVTRCRRKLQEENSDLRASDEVEEVRLDREEGVREWAKT